MSRISVFLLKETETFDFPIYEGRHIKRRIKYNSKIKKIIIGKLSKLKTNLIGVAVYGR